MTSRPRVTLTAKEYAGDDHKYFDHRLTEIKELIGGQEPPAKQEPVRSPFPGRLAAARAETLRNGQVRLVDTQDGTRVFVRKYKESKGTGCVFASGNSNST